VLVVLFDLAAHVQQEGAVGRIDHLGAVQRVDRGDDPPPVVAVGGVHHDVAQTVLSSTSTRSTAPTMPPASPIALVSRPSSIPCESSSLTRW